MSSGVGTAPLVSAIVILYNQDRFARAAIESVLVQDYRPMEVIVVDDGSTDDTAAICAGFGDRITYLRQPNAGAGAARNTGMRHARGALLAFLDGDDIWEPGKIGAQVSATRARPDAGVIVVDGVKFEDETVLAPTLYFGPVQQHFAAHGGTEMITDCYERLLWGVLIYSPSQVMIPREVFSRVGPWNTRIRVASDYELMQAHINTPPEWPSRRVQGIPPHAERALIKALAKKPRERFASGLDIGSLRVAVTALEDL